MVPAAKPNGSPAKSILHCYLHIHNLYRWRLLQCKIFILYSVFQEDNLNHPRTVWGRGARKRLYIGYIDARRQCSIFGHTTIRRYNGIKLYSRRTINCKPWLHKRLHESLFARSTNIPKRQGDIQDINNMKNKSYSKHCIRNTTHEHSMDSLGF